MDNKAEKCIFIGYKDGMKGYKIWNLVTKKNFYSCVEAWKFVGNNSKGFSPVNVPN